MSARWLVVLAACTPTPHAPPVAPPPSAAPCPPQPGVAPDNDIRIVAPPHAELVCKPRRQHCSVRVEVEVRNCRPDPIFVDHSAKPLPSGARVTFDAEFRGEGEQQATVPVEMLSYRTSIMYPDGHSHIDRSQPTRMLTEMRSPPVHVTNPERDADIAACKQCNGDWGHHDMRWLIDPTPGADPGDDCRCRTIDRGKHCEDADDCEGWCELERFVVAGKVRYPVGTCSEFASLQSCATQIPSGARAQRGRTIETQQICVD